MSKRSLRPLAAAIALLSLAEPSTSRRRAPRRPVQAALVRVARLAPGLQPLVQKVLLRGVYEFVSFSSPDSVTFMNYGYSTLDDRAEPLSLRPEDEPNRYGIQLYHAVLAGADLAGRDVLEIGCGRGGGSEFIARYEQPASVVGLDLAGKAISFCQRRYRTPGLAFKLGDAEQLPFAAGSFDYVVNVESSHGYPSMERFLAEVWRVLRPGGALLLADFRPSHDVETLRRQLHGAGFTVETDEPINANIVRALDLDSEHRAALVREHAPRLLQGLMREFTAVKDTENYNSFLTGRLQYLRFVLRKPA